MKRTGFLVMFMFSVTVLFGQQLSQNPVQVVSPQWYHKWIRVDDSARLYRLYVSGLIQLPSDTVLGAPMGAAAVIGGRLYLVGPSGYWAAAGGSEEGNNGSGTGSSSGNGVAGAINGLSMSGDTIVGGGTVVNHNFTITDSSAAWVETKSRFFIGDSAFNPMISMSVLGYPWGANRVDFGVNGSSIIGQTSTKSLPDAVDSFVTTLNSNPFGHYWDVRYDSGDQAYLNYGSFAFTMNPSDRSTWLYYGGSNVEFYCDQIYFDNSLGTVTPATKILGRDTSTGLLKEGGPDEFALVTTSRLDTMVKPIVYSGDGGDVVVTAADRQVFIRLPDVGSIRQITLPQPNIDGVIMTILNRNTSQYYYLISNAVLPDDSVFGSLENDRVYQFVADVEQGKWVFVSVSP